MMRGGREDISRGGERGKGGGFDPPSYSPPSYRGYCPSPILLLQGGRMVVGGSASRNDSNDNAGLGENRGEKEVGGGPEST